MRGVVSARLRRIPNNERRRARIQSSDTLRLESRPYDFERPFSLQKRVNMTEFDPRRDSCIPGHRIDSGL